MNEYLTIDDLLMIHHRLIEEFGGSPGLRDKNGLESAVMRPQTGYYQNIIEESAALMESLAMNHPFVDGNKRVAFFATDICARLNGYFIDCDNEKAYAFFMKLFESNRFRFDELRNWLQYHVKPL